MSGYYRVQYAELNYWLLSEQLLRNHSVIPDVTRNQLISDAFTLAEDDLIGYDIGPLQLIRYLREVNDEFVRPTAVLHLTHMMELCADSSQFEIYKVRFLLEIYAYPFDSDYRLEPVFNVN